MAEILHLPIHVLEEIFLKIPAVDLIRCSAVCKFWNEMVNDEEFISRHAQYSRATNRKHILVKGSDYCLHHDEITRYNIELSCQPPVRFISLIRLRIVGSSNGLICFLGSSDTTRQKLVFYLWNPETCEIKDISLYRHSVNQPSELGFGYDPCYMDYKILIKDRNKLTIYSLKHDIYFCFWIRKLDFNWDYHASCAELTGTLHWAVSGKASDGDNFSPFIAAFNLYEMEFRKIGLGEIYLWDRSIRYIRPDMTITIFEEKLCLILSHDYEGYKSFHIWLMEKYEDSTSWREEKVLLLQEDVERAIGFIGDRFLFQRAGGSLIVYFPWMGKASEVEFPEYEPYLEVCEYVDSLSKVSCRRDHFSKDTLRAHRREETEVDAIIRSDADGLHNCFVCPLESQQV